MNINKIRKDFPTLNKSVNNKKIIYFDNAATSLKPIQVINSQKNYYEENCANINRGLHEMSEQATLLFENSRKKIANFFGSKSEETIFTKNTTESINLLMYSLINSNFFKRGDKIVLSEMEHHSNIVPWQQLQKKGVKIEFVKINEEFELDLEDLEKKVKNSKLVSLSGASNTIATIPNLKKIEKIVHEKDRLFCVDVAQLAPHKKINFKKTNIDFIAFSGHKMLAPTGIGCLIGKKNILEEMQPFIFGGDMIKTTNFNKSIFEEIPKKFEAGTPNISGAIGLGTAIDYINKIGFDNIINQEKLLKKICLNKLKTLETKNPNNKINIYCNTKSNSAPIILFDFNKLNCHDLAILLNDEGIAIRSGMHCAEPIVTKYNKNGLARASFSFYNTKEEIDYFIEKMDFILKQIK
ncbi:MAG: aminotransferase class V-fold PLP-dependent enzyme [Candidatus ainarchaeum sp.]|nr:aminotransferase class V-fold PLP-dependent enzyme [Candidatus ainarchaeum sp.]